MNNLSSFLTYAGSFVVALGILITVHEFGHFWVARRLGVKVLRFSIGFGRPLLRRIGRVDGTEYVVAAIPLGGYVKMLDEREGAVAEAERHRAFNQQSLWRRSAIVSRRSPVQFRLRHCRVLGAAGGGGAGGPPTGGGGQGGFPRG